MKTLKISEMADKELQEEYRSLNNAINNVDCFSATDMLRFEIIEKELVNRGYTIIEENGISFIKIKTGGFDNIFIRRGILNGKGVAKVGKQIYPEGNYET
jgi:hypothetical protein